MRAENLLACGSSRLLSDAANERWAEQLSGDAASVA